LRRWLRGCGKHARILARALLNGRRRRRCRRNWWRRLWTGRRSEQLCVFSRTLLRRRCRDGGPGEHVGSRARGRALRRRRLRSGGCSARSARHPKQACESSRIVTGWRRRGHGRPVEQFSTGTRLRKRRVKEARELSGIGRTGCGWRGTWRSGRHNGPRRRRRRRPGRSGAGLSRWRLKYFRKRARLGLGRGRCRGRGLLPDRSGRWSALHGRLKRAREFARRRLRRRAWHRRARRCG